MQTDLPKLFTKHSRAQTALHIIAGRHSKVWAQTFPNSDELHSGVGICGGSSTPCAVQDRLHGAPTKRSALFELQL